MKKYVDDIEFTLDAIGEVANSSEATRMQRLIKKGLTVEQLASIYCGDADDIKKIVKKLRARLHRKGIIYGECIACNAPKPAGNLFFCGKDCRNSTTRILLTQGMALYTLPKHVVG